MPLISALDVEGVENTSTLAVDNFSVYGAVMSSSWGSKDTDIHQLTAIFFHGIV
ncbi:MAG: hypothetical protein ACI8Q2_000824 [Candidatus Omnitrophota bacterium]|jgi:hypothetical protein|tara:strand:- start:360 stop:521 length:162 start_codon:yes stop_codon:yes gene_type:complete